MKPIITGLMISLALTLPVQIGPAMAQTPEAVPQNTPAPAGPLPGLPAAPPPLDGAPPAMEVSVDPVEQAALVTSTEQFANSAAMASLLLALGAQAVAGASQDAELVAFATDSLARHTRLVEALRAAAAAGPVMVPVPLGLDMTHRQKLDALSGGVSATGAEASIEARYATMAAEIGAVAEALYTAYAEKGEDSPLKGFAAEALPEIAAEHAAAEALLARVGG
ncbi:protein of unknown function [Devosia enhydra]|uniref:DUF4142 domain-containing protein n=1 Tax=Devosia enhydra TaxID=665118 RepID=A0A1K2I061_9HYPH|nr:DUF4142 domain-containing protein [Devosia enhydra]SFZ85720.1 protein of unknown function [Devosia enhydra]